MSVSNYFSISELTTSNAPAWVATAKAGGWSIGEWIQVGGASPAYSLAATNTAHAATTASISANDLTAAMLTSWTGAAFCGDYGTKGGMFYGPMGNHNSQGSNSFGSVLVFDVDTRTWVERFAPDTSGIPADLIDGNFGNCSELGEYNSGCAITNHNGSHCVYDPHRKEYSHVRGWGNPSTGGDQYASKYGHGFHVENYTWRTYPEMPAGGVFQNAKDGSNPQGGYSWQTPVWDPNRSGFWFPTGFNSSSATGGLFFYDSANNTWTSYDPQWSIHQDHCSAIDPVRDLYISTNSTFDDTRVIDLSSPNARSSGTSLYTATDTGSVNNSASRCSLEWSDVLGAFIHVTNDCTIRRIDYVSGGLTNLVLNWSLVSTSGDTPPSILNGHYNHFQIAEWGNDVIGFRIDNHSDGAMYAVRLN